MAFSYFHFILLLTKIFCFSSMDTLFDFKKSCFICGWECIVELDPKHPNRWKKTQGVLCRTPDDGKGKQSFTDVLLQVFLLLFKTDMINLTIFWFQWLTLAI